MMVRWRHARIHGTFEPSILVFRLARRPAYKTADRAGWRGPLSIWLSHAEPAVLRFEGEGPGRRRIALGENDIVVARIGIDIHGHLLTGGKLDIDRKFRRDDMRGNVAGVHEGEREGQIGREFVIGPRANPQQTARCARDRSAVLLAADRRMGIGNCQIGDRYRQFVRKPVCVWRTNAPAQ